MNIEKTERIIISVVVIVDTTKEKHTQKVHAPHRTNDAESVLRQDSREISRFCSKVNISVKVQIANA